MRASLIVFGLLVLLGTPSCFAQSSMKNTDAAHDGVPNGWLIAGSAAKKYHYGTAAEGGERCAYIASLQSAAPDADGDFATIMQTIASDAYRGKRVRLSALLNSDAAPATGGHAALWMRVDDAGGKVVGFDNMNSRPVTAISAAHTRYEIVLDVPERSADIAFGFMQVGSGTAKAADFKLEQVDASIALTAPVDASKVLPKSPVNMDFSQR